MAPPRPWDWVPAHRGNAAVEIQGPGCFYALPMEPLAPVKVCLLKDALNLVTIPRNHHCFWFYAGRSGIRYRRISGVKTLEKIDVAAPNSPLFAEISALISEMLTGEARPGANPWEKQSRGVAAAMRIFMLVWDRCRPVATDGASRRIRRKDQLVASLHHWIRDNLQRQIRLEDAAKHFHLSSRQLLRTLKDASGTGFSDHLLTHRLLQARELLMRSRTTVIDVANSTGFNSREQFIRSYRGAFGWTPLQFRKAWERAIGEDPSLLPQLCQFANRLPVRWIDGESRGSRIPAKQRLPQTLVFSNAMSDIVEIFSVCPTGHRTREGVLDRGAMLPIFSDRAGSRWAVVASRHGGQATFETPEGDALALIEEARFPDNG